MRAFAAGLFLILAFIAAPASAKDLFKHGPVTCRSTSPDVTDLTVATCIWKKKPGGGFYTGNCDGKISIEGEEIAFNVSGTAKRIDYVYPDNDTALSFDYRGLTCSVDSPRLKAVRNCRPAKKGIGKECEVCAITAAKVCFTVRLDVAIKPPAAKEGAAILTEETVGSIAPVQ